MTRKLLLLITLLILCLGAQQIYFPRFFLWTTIENIIETRLANLPSPYQELVAALVFGRLSWHQSHIISYFKQTGLIHLLVVSGLHVNLMARLFYYLAMGPLQLLYSARLLSPFIWPFIVFFAEWFTCLFIIGFSSYVGMGIPAQRACLCFCLSFVFRHFLPRFSWIQKYALCWSIHFILIQEQLFSVSGFMSWGAHLILAQPSKHKACFFVKLLQIQILGLCCFSQTSPGYYIANTVISPCFALVFIAAVMLFCCYPLSLFTTFASYLLYFFVSLVEALAKLFQHFPQSLITIDDVILRKIILACLAVTLIIGNRRNLDELAR